MIPRLMKSGLTLFQITIIAHVKIAPSQHIYFIRNNTLYFIEFCIFSIRVRPAMNSLAGYVSSTSNFIHSLTVILKFNQFIICQVPLYLVEHIDIVLFIKHVSVINIFVIKMQQNSLLITNPISPTLNLANGYIVQQCF